MRATAATRAVPLPTPGRSPVHYAVPTPLRTSGPLAFAIASPPAGRTTALAAQTRPVRCRTARGSGQEVDSRGDSSSASRSGDGFQHFEDDGGLLSTADDNTDDAEGVEAFLADLGLDDQEEEEEEEEEEGEGLGSLDEGDEEVGEAQAGWEPSQRLTVQELIDSGLTPGEEMSQIVQLFPFQLDKFQRVSIEHMIGGRNVVVCAPTGAGKTCIAEGVAAATLCRGKRVIYTTPLKALSNQKLYEMRESFGEERIGLQTGDASLNPEADVVVMTTEILRNIMYRPPEGDDPTEPETRLSDVGLIVLDEVHYLGDPYRGSVWEEVIIGCPPGIQMLCMSATVQNPRDLGGWIEQVHGPCETVITRFRPIPLKWSFCFNGEEGVPQLEKLLDRREKRLNPKLKELMQSKRASFKSKNDGSRRRQLPAVSNLGVVEELYDQRMLPAIFFIFSRRDCDASVSTVCKTRLGNQLVTPEERAKIQSLLDELQSSQPEAVRKGAVEGLLRGVASHHAGLLPAWKKLVETAFQQGLLKVIFATETLAAGINMPARSTVISVMSRRRDGAHSLLKHNELTQMAGRAGRRGFDKIGHVVIMQSRWDGAQEAVDVILKGPEPLSSQFSASYGLVLSLLATKSLDEARSYVERSFGNYLGGEGLRRRTKEIEDVLGRAKLLLANAQAAEQEAPDPDADPVLRKSQEVQKALKTHRRQLRTLRKQARTERGQLASKMINEAGGLPRCVGLDLPEDEINWTMKINDSYEPELSVALLVRELVSHELECMEEEVSGAGAPVYIALGSDNRLMVVAAHYVAAIVDGGVPDTSEVPNSLYSSLFEMRNVAWMRVAGDYYSGGGSNYTAALAYALQTDRSQALTPVLLGDELINSMSDGLRVMRAMKLEVSNLKRDPALKAAKRAARSAKEQMVNVRDDEAEATKLLKRAERMTAEMQKQLGASWVNFEEMVKILVEFKALKPDLTPLPLGLVAREMRGENELWLAACVCHPSVQFLDAAPLAGMMAGLVAAEMMGTRPNIYVSYPPSQTVLDAAAGLEEPRATLTDLQMACSTVTSELKVDLRFSGLVEAWVAGSSWYEVTNDTSLDEGDVARLLGRTADVLRQIVYLDRLVPEELLQSAKAAYKGMNRAPISDLVS